LIILNASVRLIGLSVSRRVFKREDCTPEEFASKRKRLHLRLDELAREASRDPDVKRLVKRLALFTFLDQPGVSFNNNLAEREIRPAVLMRKNSFHNMSRDGALTQAVLMTLFSTLKLRGLDPIETIVSSLRRYLSVPVRRSTPSIAYRV
jgi:hypothetical protein